MVNKGKTLLFITIDVLSIVLSYLLAYYFRLYDYPELLNTYIGILFKTIPIIIVIYLVSFFVFKMYRSLWTIAGTEEFLMGIVGCYVATMANIFIIYLIYEPAYRVTWVINLLAGVFIMIFTLGFRISLRIRRRIPRAFNKIDKQYFKNVMIIGAGSAGAMVIKEMKAHPNMQYNPIALIDDSRNKKGTVISGVRVLGGRQDIKKIVKDKKIELIVLAIPSMSTEEKAEIIKICSETHAKVKTIPGVYEIIGGNISLSQLRDVDEKDLLGREPIKLDHRGISEYLTGKKVLVTGGGGSIGSELCRQIANFLPQELAILDIYENNAYDLQNELRRNFPNLNLKVFIASVRDKKRLESIFEEYKPEVVFHAAAHKHVPLMEDNPTEAIKNNVFGTLNVAECANKYNTKKFVLISTDKAVNPTNIMGATKRICEMIIQAMDKISDTEYVAVRFGNVLGSNGSVIPLFKKQIAEGGPVTVTHKSITRYFMLIPEAAQLVIQAGAYAKGGEIFVLDMGKPVKIYDLACDLIQLSGYTPNKDINIEITGLRPGEKLYEELLMAEEGLEKTGHDKIFVGQPIFSDIDVLRKRFDELKELIHEENSAAIRDKVEELVPTYKRTTNEKVAVTKINDEE
ncbi:polysaccharide biosynthesis protein [Clostridium sp. UBA4548]|uniref:polysaccharide biosynthesis protein n=1 Tax=Clostridium sp. UBA4548 TaxID=1946361 RepID=UPI0025B7B6F3|nr:nucleoside-diphosphate sugar epimerase/dehydratase [Clostridium sp. UBA4548]